MTSSLSGGSGSTVVSTKGLSARAARVPDAQRGGGARGRRSQVGAGAGLLVLALVAGSLAGAVWGALRPGYVVVVQDGNAVVDQAASPASVEFSSFAWFAIIAGVLGLVLSVRAYSRSGGRVSPGTMLWVIVVAAAGSFAVFTFGTWAAGFFSETPGHADLAEGARFHVIPALHPGVGWLAAPFTAALSYWLLALVTPGEKDAEPEVAATPGPTVEESR